MKKIILFLLLILALPVQAFEDCIIISDGAKLTDIRIEKNDIIDVCPLITVMNDKTTLLVTPLKEGSTRFSVLKNKNEKIIFNVNVTSEKTLIDEVSGFDILTLDEPYEAEKNDTHFELDQPPQFKLNYFNKLNDAAETDFENDREKVQLWIN